MTVKITTDLGVLTVSGKKSVINSLGMVLCEASAYNKDIGCPCCSGQLMYQAMQIRSALYDVGYYKDIHSNSENN